MRIGIDCRTILNPQGSGEHAGVGHYTYYLVKHCLEVDRTNEYVLFFDHRVRESPFPEAPNVRFCFFPFFQLKKYLPFAYSHIFLPFIIQRHHCDVFHGPANVIPIGYHGRSVVTVHDLAIYRNPSWFPSGQNFSTKTLIPKSLQRANRIIAVSESTKKDIQKFFHIPSSKIRVIVEGVEQSDLGGNEIDPRPIQRFDIQKPYILFIGTLEPRKNLERLVRSFAILKDDSEIAKQFPNLSLVLAGLRGLGIEDLLAAIRNNPWWDNIHVLGYVSHDEKSALFANASVFAFPSLWEGFGLPILEAMNAGVPVLTSKVSAIPEVAKDAAFFIDPNDIKDISRGLKKVLSPSPLRKDLIERGYLRAKKFQWEDIARQTIAVYRETGSGTLFREY